MAGPKVESLNYVIDFIKDSLAGVNYNLEDLFGVRVQCGTIVQDGDKIYLLNKICELLNESLSMDDILHVNYILSYTLYCLYYDNNAPLYFSMNNNVVTYG